MTPEALTQLVGSGNTSTIEDEWMSLLESPDATVRSMTPYSSVLAALKEKGRTSEAEALAWTAVEAICANSSKSDGLTLAGDFLLMLGNTSELRAQVTELYREVHGHRDGSGALIEEAGIAGSRPVRRALRTLRMCFPLAEGDYLTERDEDGAARVETIDTITWEFTITDGRRTETLGAVQLADRFEPAAPDDFGVMRCFRRDELESQLRKDPLARVIELCKGNGGSIDSSQLETVLVPGLIPGDEWKKWWTKTRGALKKCSSIRLTGRSPYLISYVDESTHDQEFLLTFDKLYDPLEKLSLLERYIKERKQHDSKPAGDVLRKCHDQCMDQAVQDLKRREPTLLRALLVAARVGELAGVENFSASVVETLTTAENLKEIFAAVGDPSLLKLACEKLVEARPTEWKQLLAGLLPGLPTAVCDKAASLLIEGGFTHVDFEPIIRRILASPVASNDALLWIWDGPTNEATIAPPAPITLLKSVLDALEECQRDDTIGRLTTRAVSQRSRAVLSARKYERYIRCLEGLEPGVAATLRTQIRRLDNLGRTVHQQLQSHISRLFPPVGTSVDVRPWERDDVLFVTGEGMIRKQAELDEHVNVKMRDNARAIGEAASLGDLSENAEYKSALEERDLLRSRLALMNDEMALAEVFHAEDVPTDHVGIGSRVVFRRTDDGSPYTLTLVGPWSADLNENRLNYKAPLAQRVLGKIVGDVIVFEHDAATGKYEIVAIENDLEEEGPFANSTDRDDVPAS